MYSTYIVQRTQIYLDEDQARLLLKRAEEVGVTKSALIREAIDAYLSPAAGSEAALAALRSAVMEAAGAAPYLPNGMVYVEESRAADLNRLAVGED